MKAILQLYKLGNPIEVKLFNTKEEAIREGKKYMSKFTVHQKVKESRANYISRPNK